MKPFDWLLLLCFFLPSIGIAQGTSLPSAPLGIHYTIYATANDTAGTVAGVEKITVINRSADAIKTICLKLYPNAYSSDWTRYGEYLLKQRDLRFYFADKSSLGSITQLDFSVGDQPLDWRYTDRTHENVRLQLPHLLQRGDSVEIQTPFLLKLPRRLDVYGYAKNNWILTKWYPELAPWTKEDGWEDSSTLTELQTVASLPADYTVLFTSSQEDKLWTNGEVVAAQQHLQQYSDQKTQIFQLKNAAGFDIVLALQDSDLPSEYLTRENAGQGNESMADLSLKLHSDDAAQSLFKQLLPGPLATKRPVHPAVVLRQTRAELLGGTVAGQKPVKPAFLLNLKNADSVHYLSFSPAFGYNDYDKLMAGVLIHNYQLPLSKFDFLVAPMFATKTRQITGLAAFDYRIPAVDHLWQFSLNASRYSFDNYLDWTDDKGIAHPAGQMRLLRVVPAVHYTQYKTPGNVTKGWDLGMKAYILNANKWHLSGNSLSMENSSDIIGEVKAGLWDKRILYPYKLEFKVNGTDNYLRMGLTGKYFLNYDAQGNGLQLRGYAGKFFYLKQRTSLDAYTFGDAYLSLSGTDGSHDYTYSNYFVGRSAYEGWMSQQISEDDGFFKVSTPQLSSPVGISDDWVAAVNLTTDIPKNINPFAALPFRLPVRFFLDIGTYSQAWADNPATGRFLYDAGLQVSVLKEAVTVYFPLLYSKFYRDTYKSMGYDSYFSHTIRFSINLGKLKPKVLQKIFLF